MLDNLYKTAPLDEYQLPRYYLDDRSYILLNYYTIYQQLRKCNNKTDRLASKRMLNIFDEISFTLECTSGLNGYDAIYKKLHHAFSTLSTL